MNAIPPIDPIFHISDKDKKPQEEMRPKPKTVVQKTDSFDGGVIGEVLTCIKKKDFRGAHDRVCRASFLDILEHMSAYILIYSRLWENISIQKENVPERINSIIEEPKKKTQEERLLEEIAQKIEYLYHEQPYSAHIQNPWNNTPLSELLKRFLETIPEKSPLRDILMRL